MESIRCSSNHNSSTRIVRNLKPIFLLLDFIKMIEARGIHYGHLIGVKYGEGLYC